MRIEIVNWAKYNPRSDVKHPSWFRLENSFWSDNVIFDLDNDGKMVWITLLALASQGMSGVVNVNTAFIATVLRVDKTKVESVLDTLQDTDKIKKATLRKRNKSVTSTGKNVPLRTNGTGRNGTGRDERVDLSDDKSLSTAASAAGRPGLSPKDLALLWNEKSHPNMAKVEVSSFRAAQPRYRASQARLKEHPDLAYWQRVIDRMNLSTFCRGEVEPRDGRKPFRADFDFFTRAGTHVKVLEGKYDDLQSAESGGKQWTDYLSQEEKAKHGIP